MKVVGFNGSPKQTGNTYHALRAVMEPLEQQGIQTEIIHVGGQALRGCIGCRGCAQLQNETCVLPDDGVNGWIQKMKEADGILLASPVYFANIAGSMKCFLDRAFYVCSNNGGLLRHKVGAVAAAVRRTGGLPAVDTMTHYLSYSEMVMPGANYWNVIHGRTPGEVLQDEEGLQDLRILGKNMAWLLRLMEYGRQAVPAPQPEEKIITNFVR